MSQVSLVPVRAAGADLSVHLESRSRVLGSTEVLRVTRRAYWVPGSIWKLNLS